jgi:hypothetical protein
MVSGTPPALGSDDTKGATVELSAVPSLRMAFPFSALNRSTCACTVLFLMRNVRLTPKSSWFKRGSYLVPGDASCNVIEGSPAKRAGSTMAPGTQPATVQSFGYRVLPLVIVQLTPPAEVAVEGSFFTPG